MEVELIGMSNRRSHGADVSHAASELTTPIRGIEYLPEHDASWRQDDVWQGDVWEAMVWALC